MPLEASTVVFLRASVFEFAWGKFSIEVQKSEGF